MLLDRSRVTLDYERASGCVPGQQNRSNQPHSLQEIQSHFVSYYQSQGFQRLPRASLLHPSIPMSFVMSAGLAQVEMALSLLPSSSGHKFVLVQDCFRHFDLEKVGHDDTHLSLFEMPGAFEFGANAKQSTIYRMWNLATQELKIAPNRLWVSYFAGGEIADHRLSADQETYRAWCEIGISPERIVGWGVEDNYWIQSQSLGHIAGQPRKCGPNTELFYDFGVHKSCDPNCRPGCNCGRFLEFSNSLFITYEITEDNEILKPLHTPFTETVIGSERVAAILQHVSSVFEIDEYASLIDLVRNYSHATDLPEGMLRESEKIFVDHVKALCFLIVDGAPLPGKNGRERIIKLLIRKTIARMKVLKISESVFWPLLLEGIINQYELPEKVDQLSSKSLVEKIMTYVLPESGRFHRTIERGYKKMENLFLSNTVGLLEEQMVDLEKNWGFPFPLMAVWLHDKKIPFSIQKYYSALAKWRCKNIQ